MKNSESMITKAALTLALTGALYQDAKANLMEDFVGAAKDSGLVARRDIILEVDIEPGDRYDTIAVAPCMVFQIDNKDAKFFDGNVGAVDVDTVESPRLDTMIAKSNEADTSNIIVRKVINRDNYLQLISLIKHGTPDTNNTHKPSETIDEIVKEAGKMNLVVRTDVEEELKDGAKVKAPAYISKEENPDAWIFKNHPGLQYVFVADVEDPVLAQKVSFDKGFYYVAKDPLKDLSYLATGDSSSVNILKKNKLMSDARRGKLNVVNYQNGKGSISIDGYKGKGRFRIYNMKNQIVYEGRLEDGNADFDLSNKSSGMYAVKVGTSVGKYRTKLLKK